MSGKTLERKESTPAQNRTDDTEPPSGKNPHGSEVERIHTSGYGDVIQLIMMSEITARCDAVNPRRQRSATQKGPPRPQAGALAQEALAL